MFRTYLFFKKQKVIVHKHLNKILLKLFHNYAYTDVKWLQAKSKPTFYIYVI